MTRVFLAGDIGGTKTTLGLFKQSDNTVKCIDQNTYCSLDFDHFSELLNLFLEPSAQMPIDVVCLSVAGPVLNQEVHTTNLPWLISVRELQQQFPSSRIALLNDIEATGLGLLQTPPDSLIQINPQAKITEDSTTKGNRAIVSVGTGLGEAVLFWNNGHYSPSASEGGHEDFAPTLEEDLALWHYLKQHYPQHISYERIISGPGIALLYDYVCTKQGLTNLAPEDNAPAWISHRAITGEDKICVEAMQIFIRYLAHEAANLSLKVLATGGLYLAGGVSAKLAEFIQASDFMTHFCDKGRFEGLLRTCPVWISLNGGAAFDGAIHHAHQLMQEMRPTPVAEHQ